MYHDADGCKFYDTIDKYSGADMTTRRSEEIEERLLEFAVSVIKLTTKNKASLPFSVIDQVVRSSSSIGANYSEAQNASSKADFKNKIFIAKKEASETRYWLRLIQKLVNKDANTATLLDESQQILMILQKIVNTLNGKSDT